MTMPPPMLTVTTMMATNVGLPQTTTKLIDHHDHNDAIPLPVMRITLNIETMTMTTPTPTSTITSTLVLPTQ